MYFLVNRKDRPIEAPQLDVSKAGASAKWYDCWNGVPLVCPASSGKLTFEIESHGFACAVGTTEAVTLDDGVAGPTADELRSEAPPAVLSMAEAGRERRRGEGKPEASPRQAKGEPKASKDKAKQLTHAVHFLC